jgi:hypothetical protein
MLGLRLLVSIWFQKLFHSPSGVLFTFPSRYLFTIGHYEYLALDLSRPDFRPDFSCLDVLKKKLGKCIMFRYTGLSPSLVRRSRRILLHSTHVSLWVYRPTITSTYNTHQATPVSFKSPFVLLRLSKTLDRFGLIEYLFTLHQHRCVMNKYLYISPFARHYWGNLSHSCEHIDLFSTCYWDVSLRMVPAYIHPRVYSIRSSNVWVSPFGHPRIKAYLPAPRGFSQAITSFIGS